MIWKFRRICSIRIQCIWMGIGTDGILNELNELSWVFAAFYCSRTSLTAVVKSHQKSFFSSFPNSNPDVRWDRRQRGDECFAWKARFYSNHKEFSLVKSRLHFEQMNYNKRSVSLLCIIIIFLPRSETSRNNESDVVSRSEIFIYWWNAL